MKLCVQQKMFTFGDKFNIYDVNGNVKYTCEGEVFTLGKKLHVYDEIGDEVAYIEQQLFQFLPSFTVYVRGEAVAEIVKEFTLFVPKYYVNGLDWNVDGEFLARDYHISRNGEKIADFYKEWMTFGDCYSMDINDDYDEVLALSVCLAVDVCISASRNNNH